MGHTTQHFSPGKIGTQLSPQNDNYLEYDRYLEKQSTKQQKFLRLGMNKSIANRLGQNIAGSLDVSTTYMKAANQNLKSIPTVL